MRGLCGGISSLCPGGCGSREEGVPDDGESFSTGGGWLLSWLCRGALGLLVLGVEISGKPEIV